MKRKLMILIAVLACAPLCKAAEERTMTITEFESLPDEVVQTIIQ